MSGTDRVEIERWRYWQGQELRGRDLRGQLMSEAQLRWWHNRALHNAFGVRYGMTVSGVLDGRELVAARVDCGLAYDCFGRELILQTRREVPLPGPEASPAGLTLLARYKGAPGRNGSPGACAPAARARLLEEPEFVWTSSTRVGPGEGVPLARLTYEPAARLASLPAEVEMGLPPRRVYYDAARELLIARGRLSDADKAALLGLSDEPQFQTAVEELSQAALRAPVLENHPRVARPLARPRIGSGATVPEGTAWERWTERVGDQQRHNQTLAVGYQVTVDTTAAGFVNTPCYFAWLEGTLWERGRSNTEFFPVPLTHLDLTTPRQFRFRLWLPAIPMLLGARLRVANLPFADEFINFARRQRLYVCWLGVEPGTAAAAPRCAAAAEEPECHTRSEA